MLPQQIAQYLQAELALEEGQTSFVYDDAAGPQPFKQGMTLRGNLTAAVGVNLSAGLDNDEMNWLSQHRMEKVIATLLMDNWYETLDPVRMVAIADIVFNLGTGALQKWPNFFRFIAQKDWPNAVNEIKTNEVWISQVHPARAGRLENMLTTGNWPSDVIYEV